MASTTRTTRQNLTDRNGTLEGNPCLDDKEVAELAAQKAIREGIGSIAGAARFALAVSLDLLRGDISANDAAIHVRTANIQLKAAELHLKHRRKACRRLCVDAKGL